MTIRNSLQLGLVSSIIFLTAAVAGAQVAPGDIAVSYTHLDVYKRQADKRG